MVGIYKITNNINKKVYIGQSRQLEIRMYKHTIAYVNRNDAGYNYHLYKSMRLYGIDNFKFEIIEHCSVEDLNDRELYWITHYGSTNNDIGYNKSMEGFLLSPMKLNVDDLNEIRKLLEEGSAYIDIADKFNISRQMVSRINIGRSWYDESIKYPIRDESIRNIDQVVVENTSWCIDCNSPIKDNVTRCLTCYKIDKSKHIPTKDELLDNLKDYNFSETAGLYNVSERTVRKWCIKRDIPTKLTDIRNKIN